ncbi:MAG: hypothetical protein EAZ58_05650 [Flavobacterium sp.]|nr:MAG: hypothetical protein EAZ58_05650 [Flavobacterium sp.]
MLKIGFCREKIGQIRYRDNKSKFSQANRLRFIKFDVSFNVKNNIFYFFMQTVSFAIVLKN